jgi:hypothetical protein
MVIIIWFNQFSFWISSFVCCIFMLNYHPFNMVLFCLKKSQCFFFPLANYIGCACSAILVLSIFLFLKLLVSPQQHTQIDRWQQPWNFKTKSLPCNQIAWNKGGYCEKRKKKGD